VQWNTSKIYLADLKSAGIAVVSTQFWQPGEPTLNPPGGPVVIKPAVGVGGEGVRRYGPAEQSDALRRVRQLQDEGQVVLVQPYLDSVETVGEISVVYFDAAYSHAVRRKGFLPEGEETDTDCQPDARQRGLADQMLDYLTDRFGAPLYARIDILEGPSGPVVSEVEVTDPVVHLCGKPDRAARFAGAIADRLPS
jgi:glutathione synthase/RimK-type ligase-like ATP-grasp enzyme